MKRNLHAALQNGPSKVSIQRLLEASHVVLDHIDELCELVLPVRDRLEFSGGEPSAKLITDLL